MGTEEGNMCFRIGLRTKGCNGMAYTLEYAEPDSKLKFEEQVYTVYIELHSDVLHFRWWKM